MRPDEGDEIVTSAVGLGDVSPAILACDTFTHLDYVDCFTIAIAGDMASDIASDMASDVATDMVTSSAADRSPEQWARRVLEDTPTGRSAPVLWRSLGLRLGPARSPEHVQGWAIGGRGADWVRIETTSWYMTAHAVVRVDDGHVSLALFLRYDHPLAPVIWAPVSVLHRRGVPVMLRQAVANRRPATISRDGGAHRRGPAVLRGPRMATNAVVRARR